MATNDPATVHDRVRETYATAARAVTAGSGSCCGGSAGCGTSACCDGSAMPAFGGGR